VHLRNIAHIEERPTQSMIARENQQYQRWITFEFRGRGSWAIAMWRAS
jgi:Cu/Ag efflux pump CusA